MQAKLNEWRQLSAEAASRVRMLPTHILQAMIGIVLGTPILLEFIVSRDYVEKLFRGWDGVLTPLEASLIVPTALVSCFISVAVMHWAVNKLPGSFRGRAGTKTSTVIGCLALAAVSLVVLSQPFVSIVTDLSFGNSIDVADTSLTLQNKLITAGHLARLLIVLLAALTATKGFMILQDALRLIAEVVSDFRRVVDLNAAIRQVDEGYQEAERMVQDGLDQNSLHASQFASAVSEGMQDMASTVSKYLRGSDMPYVNAELWLEELAQQFDMPVVVPNLEIKELVRLRLKQHYIDFQLLPSSSNELSPEARANLADYAGWLRQHADYDSIYDATVMKLEGYNA